MRRLGSRFLAVALSLAVQAGRSQGAVDSPQVKNWAWDQVKSWHFQRKDPQGHPVGANVPFHELAYGEQTAELLNRLSGSALERRAALVLLGTRPTEEWALQSLRRTEGRDEAALWLYRHGFKYTDREPFRYLEPSARLSRPWTQGLGLHLEGSSWSFQWIPDPALLSRKQGTRALPAPLEAAPIPTAMLRLKHLRAGLERLQAVAGGETGVVGTLAEGTRAGFLLRHLRPWLKQTPPGLEPLADREAWVLHYGLSRGFGPAEGTLVFLPGELPARTSLVMDLLKLNPTTFGPRSRERTWEDGHGGKVRVSQIRGAGGVLHLLATPGGTWISDREAPLRAVAFPTPFPTLGERGEWCRVALAALHPDTEASLWLLPRLGASAAFERAALRRDLLGLDQSTWANPGIAKAAPRTGALAAALGAGPTEVLLGAILRVDRDGMPTLPVLPQGPIAPTPEQRRDYEREAAALAARRTDRSRLARDLESLQALLDLRGAAFLWKGWVTPPPLSAAQSQSLADFQRLRRADPGKAARLERMRRIDVYGGFLEPGLCPGIALALPVRAGKVAQAEEQMKRLWPRLFKGTRQNREFAKGAMIHRVLTDQAFRPSYAFLADTLVLGTDDQAVQDVLAGLLGQVPTLADVPSTAYGRVELDGGPAARDLEILLLAYLRANQGGRSWWLGEPETTADEASAEVASSFGPFLGALRALGRRHLALELTAGGFEARPR